MKRHKGIRLKPPMRDLTLRLMMRSYNGAGLEPAPADEQKPWTVLIPHQVATSIEPTTGHPRPVTPVPALDHVRFKTYSEGLKNPAK